MSLNKRPFPAQQSPLLKPKQPPVALPNVLRMRTRLSSRGNLLLDLPIAGRLALGFLSAALLAAFVTGAIGLQRAQSLDRQSAFYQNLLQTNTTLTTGANFLQLMNTTTHSIIDVAAQPQPSQETLQTDQKAARDLATRYDNILTGYIAHNLLHTNQDEVSLLTEGNHADQVNQQITLAGSALRTWRVYRAAQEQVLKDIAVVTITQAKHFEQVQGEPTNADALSALRSLIQFDGRLAISVQDAALVEEQNQQLLTSIGAVVAFIIIGLVGLVISNTLVKRLKQLRRVTQDVEEGKLNARVTVVGRDEIADVSASVNAMLEGIVGLIQETSQQRDALTNAAEHLFSDMRVVSAGDLRINAPVSNDPIGLLANAFNFTVSRFRRFVLRTQGNTEQLDVIARQELKRIEKFLQVLNKYAGEASAPLASPVEQVRPQLMKGFHTVPSRLVPAADAGTQPLEGEQRKALPAQPASTTKDQTQEIVRLSGEFAHEISTLARKIMALVHETRSDTVSFQLDVTNNTTGINSNNRSHSGDLLGNPAPDAPDQNMQKFSPRY